MDECLDFPVQGLLPKIETEALKFLTKYPNFDGKGVIIAILDTGVDPGAPGLKITSDSKPKIIDCIDATGSGDVDISIVKEISNDAGYIIGLSERKLFIPKSWTNPSGKYYCGLKAAFDLYPGPLKDRMRKERKDKLWLPEHELALANARKALDAETNNSADQTKNFDTNLNKEELQAKFDVIKDLESKVKDPGPVYDCLVWNDADGVWCACIDTSETGDLEKCQVLTNFKDSHQYGTFSHIDMLNYAIRIMPEKNILQIVTDAGSHGTHVASICAGYHEDNSEINGIAPGAQILSIKIGDNRISGMETCYAIVNAMKYVAEYKCHLLNYSFGEPISYFTTGPALAAFEEIVEKHGVIACVSAGNSGPGLTTAGAPGAYSKSVISVGAYVSTEMLKAEHSIIKRGKPMLFTWSSRGPTTDGSTGVTVCAPGGAFASVPHWTLRGTQLMSGTSMASPNCCGSIAIILSGLIANDIEYYPYGIERALMNTAVKVGDELGSGAGLIQIDKAFDYLMKNHDDILNKIQFDLKCGPKGKRGVFLKLHKNSNKSIDYSVTIEPKFFNNFEDKNKFFKNQNDKISLKMKVALISEDSWVECPKNVYVVNNSKQFSIKINLGELPEGRFHYTQIKAYDVENISKSCVFRIPITIIKPICFSDKEKDYEVKFENVNFTQGQIERHFIQAPNGATHAEINFKYDESNRDHAPLFTIQTFTFDDFHSHDYTEKESDYSLNLINNFKYIFQCESNKIVQICVCKKWSNIGNISASYSIKFRGLCPNNSSRIDCLSSEPCRIDINCLQDFEECEPAINWKYLFQPLRPSEATNVELVRGRYGDIRSIYQITLTYSFHQTKSGELCCESPLLSNVLYESEYQSIFWILFDSNKRPLCYGDSFPTRYKYSKSIDKGDYTIKLHVRHEKLEQLEKLKNLVLYARQSANNIPQDMFRSYASLLKGAKKSNSPERVLRGHQYTIFLDSISDEKLPKGASPGHFLKGELTLYKDPQISKIDTHEIFYHITDNASKKSKTSEEKEKEKKTEEEKLNEAVRDVKVSWILKSNELYEKLLEEYENHIPLYLNRVKYLDQQVSSITDDVKLKTQHLTQMIEISKLALGKINQNELLCYFGVKKHDTVNEELKKEMDTQKSWIIELLTSQGVAIYELNLIDFSIDNIQEVKNIYQALQKWVDINDEKVSKFLLKFCLMNKFYGKALKILLKQNEEKPSLSTDKLVLDTLIQLRLNYSVYYYENDMILKYPKSFAKF